MTTSAAAQVVEEPETLIRQGNELRRQHDNTRAHGYMKRAYDIAHTPRSAAQLGLVEQALGQFREAEQHLSEALSSRDPWVLANKSSLESGRTAVRAKLGKVEITGAPAGTEVAIETEPPFKLPADGVVWLSPGRTTLRLEATGHEPATKTVTLKMGQSVPVAAELSPLAPMSLPRAMPSSEPETPAPGTSPPEKEVAASSNAMAGGDSRRSLRITGLAVAGSGLVLGVTGFVLRAMASSKLDAIAQDAAAGRPYDESNGNWRGLDRGGVTLIAVGGAALVTGAVLALVKWSPSARVGSAQVSFLSISPDRREGAVLQIGGRY